MSNFTESVVEDATLAWLENLGYTVKHGPDITPGGDTLTLTPSTSLRTGLSQWERENYSEVVLAGRLRQALARSRHRGVLQL
jgi:type I restriction enzyme R subunit